MWRKCLLLVLWIYKDFTDTLASASPLLSYYHPATSQEVITLISGPFTSKEYQLRIPLSLHPQALMFPNEEGGNGSVVSWYSKITSLYFLSVRAALQFFWSAGSFPLMHSANFSQQPLWKVRTWVCAYVCVQPTCVLPNASLVWQSCEHQLTCKCSTGGALTTVTLKWSRKDGAGEAAILTNIPKVLTDWAGRCVFQTFNYFQCAIALLIQGLYVSFYLVSHTRGSSQLLLTLEQWKTIAGFVFSDSEKHVCKMNR